MNHLESDDMIHRIAAALLPALLGAGPLAAQDKAGTYPVEKHLNLAYNPARDADPVRHKLDLYVPKGATDVPVMMFVHGGAWKTGTKDLYAALGETFAKQGIGTAVINYRLSGGNAGAKHPEHVRDVAKAFAWVKANAGKYGGSKDKLFVSGHSAGGHLVSLLATDEQYLTAEGCSAADIKGVMTISGVYTISNLVATFHDIFGKDDAVCRAASPITHVKEAKGPPFLIAYGTNDFPFLDQMAEQFGKKLAECKRDAKVLKLDRDHYSIIIRLAASADDELTRGMVEFMKK